MAGAVERYGGIVEKFIGDAVFALFGARAAHDDDALRAALCALEMTATLERAARPGAARRPCGCGSGSRRARWSPRSARWARRATSP